MLGLWCSVKTYHWGKRGSESLVARLAKRACHAFVLEEHTPYAEVPCLCIRCVRACQRSCLYVCVCMCHQNTVSSVASALLPRHVADILSSPSFSLTVCR